MRVFQDKKNRKRRLYSGLSIIILIVICAFLSKAVFNIYIKYKESSISLSQAEARFNELQGRSEKLQAEMEGLKTDMGREREIRSKYNVVKPGEKVVMFVKEEEELATTTEEGFFKGFISKLSEWF